MLYFHCIVFFLLREAKDWGWLFCWGVVDEGQHTIGNVYALTEPTPPGAKEQTAGVFDWQAWYLALNSIFQMWDSFPEAT